MTHDVATTGRGEAGHADSLREYAQLKLALADAVAALLRAAQHERRDRVAQDCQSLLARVAEDRFQLAFVGQFSRGKSSLMNALLGEARLPIGVLPMTSVITIVEYGESEQVLLRRQGSRIPHAIRLDELADYVTQRGNPGNEKNVIAAEIQLPNELLRMGVAFVDTPGVGSTVLANTRTTREYVPAIDAAVLVTSVESPMTEAEVALLSELCDRVPTVFIVVNKKDLLAGEDDEVMENVHAVLDAAFAGRRFESFLVSARDALAAKTAKAAAALAGSGLPLFEAALAIYLQTRKASDFLHRAIASAARIIQDYEFESEIGRRFRTPEELATMQSTIEGQVAAIADDIERLGQRLKERLHADFEANGKGVAALSHGAIASQLEATLRASPGKDSALAEVLPWPALIERALQSVTATWKDQTFDAIQSRAEGVFRAERSDLARIASEMAAIGADRIGATGLEREDERLLDTPPFVCQEMDLRSLADRTPWWYELVPSGPLWQTCFRRWLRHIEPLVAAYRSEVFAMLHRSANEWSDDIVRQLHGCLKNAAARVHTALQNGATGTNTAEIARLRDGLDAIRRRLACLETPTGQPAGLLRDAASTPPLPPCPVCARVERDVFERLAHVQYELYSNETAQAEHASRLGFCRLHSWQYETIASPQGVCAAYPPLLAHIAKNLRSAAKGDLMSRASKDRLRRLTMAKRCPACEWVATATELATREAAALPGDQPGYTVCLAHLPLLLAYAPNQTAAREWMASAATALDRVAEDMRSYALKHNAVRRGLSTRAERRAATSGMARLVGRRTLVSVKSDV